MITNSKIAINCKNVSKSFFKTEKGSRSWRNLFRGEVKEFKALDAINLNVYKNEVFGLLGSNGSGKSTLIRLLSTLLRADSGEIKILGLDVVDDPDKIRLFINRVSVEASFFKKLTAMENLRFVARTYNIAPKEARVRISFILEKLGITKDKLDVPLETFSRGMQQKVAIARAFLTRPKLILLDEPTTGLDPKSKRDVQHYVETIMKQQDLTILLTTHDMTEAEKLCDRIAIIEKGKIIALDTSENLKRKNNAKSLEEVFLKITGKNWEEALGDED